MEQTYAELKKSRNNSQKQKTDHTKSIYTKNKKTMKLNLATNNTIGYLFWGIGWILNFVGIGMAFYIMNNRWGWKIEEALSPLYLSFFGVIIAKVGTIIIDKVNFKRWFLIEIKKTNIS